MAPEQMNGSGGTAKAGTDDGNLFVHLEIVLKLRTFALLRKSARGAATGRNRSSTAGNCIKSLWLQTGPKYFLPQSSFSFLMR
ncbi:MAG: hypothetical protein KGJ04_01095 [Gammaproteobacteria bacterium]|nr:hypothetical protein [Gammaproteobacteria bacterium]